MSLPTRADNPKRAWRDAAAAGCLASVTGAASHRRAPALKAHTTPSWTRVRARCGGVGGTSCRRRRQGASGATGGGGDGASVCPRPRLLTHGRADGGTADHAGRGRGLQPPPLCCHGETVQLGVGVLDPPPAFLALQGRNRGAGQTGSGLAGAGPARPRRAPAPPRAYLCDRRRRRPCAGRRRGGAGAGPTDAGAES